MSILFFEFDRRRAYPDAATKVGRRCCAAGPSRSSALPFRRKELRMRVGFILMVLLNANNDQTIPAAAGRRNESASEATRF